MIAYQTNFVHTLFDQAVKVIHSCGVGAELAKCNIKSAFGFLLVHLSDFDLL